MKSKQLGELKQDKELAGSQSKDYFSINNVPTPLFNHQECLYCFDFDNSPDLTLEDGDSALENFFNIDSILKNEVSQKVFANWQEFNDSVGFLDAITVFQANKSRPKWQEDALQNALWLEKLAEPQQVWEYLTPSEIVITKDRYQKKKGVYIQVLCQCAWEDEHGLQIILKEGSELTRVSGQDGNLFDYYA